ncbi:tetratricopeptide repeat protein [Paraburkholderia sp. Ac-20347]|uniref:O-linked N-acetylglucosamine transferase family protein n=1 Tax=Paraburkholderia sp. Ac-20347 TaxID=2703892 RepID=UPI0019826798|nr:tetratricopeptide repeat protein [Paraburkholderia sp. Ac-20347]MBN3810754.1 tetratricopeptide repeat protein [Paraburkholderia sp. Ac-20347]
MTAFLTPDRPSALAAESSAKNDIALAMQRAVELHQRQEYDEAAAIYRAILQAANDHADAHYHLGVLYMQTGRPADAVPHFEAALGQVPKNGQIWVYYINALVASAQTEAAGMALDLARQNGLPDDAVRALRARINGEELPVAAEPEPEVAPEPESDPEAAANADEEGDEEAESDNRVKLDVRRASAKEMRQIQQLISSGKLDVAVKVGRRLTQQYPAHGECWLELGRALQGSGHYSEAVDAIAHAARLLPNNLIVQLMLADRLVVARQYGRAAEHCKKVIEKYPDNALLHRNLGSALQELGLIEEGFEHMRRAVELAPNNPIELDALATALGKHGLFDESEATYRRALALAPTLASTHSNLLFYLMHKPNFPAASAFAEFREFAARQEAPLRKHWLPHSNDRDPSRVLRIGFVSGDLINHPVAYFFLSVLEHLARDPSLSLHIYSNYMVRDAFTERLRPHAQTWNEVFGMSNDAVVKKIRDDRIDILIDLSGHTGRNLLVAFAHKPAPIQASWIGNPSTTGLDSVDYYLSDRFVTPFEEFESRFSEKLVFLPALAPFKPHPDAPDVNELPALKNGYMTFGSFSRIVKISKDVVALWARVLREVPGSRLVMGAVAAQDQMMKLTQMFADEGVDVERISFLRRAGVTDYLRQHNVIDVCLDTFPFGNSTTTMQALWMGVPTMTLPGDSMASRSSTGWLSHLGIDAPFVAQDKDDFVRKCAMLAADPEALAIVRSELREFCRQSVLIDAEAISNAAARAFRIMWQRWCAGLAPEHFEVHALPSAEKRADEVAPQAPVEQAPVAPQPVEQEKPVAEPQARSKPIVAPIVSIAKDAASTPGVKPIRFVCGTRLSREQFHEKAALGRSLKLFAHMQNVQLQLFDNNAHGLSSIYNAAIADAKRNPAILVFIHDDVWLTDVFWADRVLDAIQRFDVAGLAGNVRRMPGQLAWCYTADMKQDERKYLSGTVAHGNGFPSDNVLAFGPSGKECKLLDGLLLIVDSETLMRHDLRFDEQFKFHFYDMDFCRQAEAKGVRMGTCPLSVVHESKGGCDNASWRESRDLYLQKYGS